MSLLTRPRLPKRRWLLVPVIVAALALTYALAGFVLAPWIAKRELPRYVEQQLRQRARIGEISFNSSFMGEVAAIAFFEELMQSRPADPRFRRLFIHGIGDEALGAFGASSKMNNHPDFLAHLREIGTRAADLWLAHNRDAIGKRSTVDLSGLVPTRHGSLIGPSTIKQTLEVQA